MDHPRLWDPIHPVMQRGSPGFSASRGIPEAHASYAFNSLSETEVGYVAMLIGFR